MRPVAALLAAGAVAVAAQPAASIAAFSAAAGGGAIPAPWRPVAIPNVKAPEFTLAEDAGRTVLRVRAESAAGSLAHDLSAAPAATPILSWRWKVQRSLGRAKWGTRDGDDFAARVYVTFDVPADALPLLERAKLALGRLLYGDDLPAAAICYVWASGVAAGTTGWSPYTERVRIVVLESGDARSGQWVSETRDLEADFRAAFGGPAPRVTAVLVAADTDQTRESVTAWFGDLRLEARQ